MPESEVRQILGAPSRVRSPAESDAWRPRDPECRRRRLSATWIYDRWLRDSWLIYLDETSRVACVESAMVIDRMVE